MEELNVNLANILKQMKNSSVKVTSLKSINCRKKSIWKTKKHEQIIGVVILIVGIVLWEWDLFTNEKVSSFYYFSFHPSFKPIKFSLLPTVPNRDAIKCK